MNEDKTNIYSSEGLGDEPIPVTAEDITTQEIPAVEETSLEGKQPLSGKLARLGGKKPVIKKPAKEEAIEVSEPVEAAPAEKAPKAAMPVIHLGNPFASLKKKEGEPKEIKRRDSKPAEGNGAKKSGGKKKRKKLSPVQRVLVALLKFIIIVGCLCVIAGCAVLVMTSVYLVNVTADDDALLDLNSIELSYSTRFMAKNPETGDWEEYERIYGEENRIWIDYADMPQHLIDATVASEDARFWSHKGVDWKRTIAAFINYLPGIDLWETNQGGSTIYQQLIKNITGENEAGGFDGVLRKVREIYRALALDKRYSKDQVMEAYLNTINLSGTVCGIESAAKHYFGKTTGELTVAECAAIVCITKSPTAYNPYLYPDANKVQRNTVLYNMYDYGMLTEAEYNAAKAESEAMVFLDDVATEDSDDGVWSWFTETARKEVLRDLQEICGYTGDEAYDLFYNGGLTVYLTVDQAIQNVMEAEVDKIAAGDDELWPSYITHVTDEGVEERVEGAMVVMNYRGELLGITGSMYEKTDNTAFNRAVDATRSTGSSMKPIAVYAPALETDKITYSTLFEDAPITIMNDDDEPEEWPRNYDHTYGAPVTVNVGLRKSLNTTAVHTMQLIGFDYSFDFLTTRLGISTLVETYYDATQGKYVGDRTNSLALGGLTYGVSLYEMVAAYLPFGNAGTYVEPHSYTIVEDSNGNILINKETSIRTVQALSEDTAYIMNKLMQEVFTWGTGTSARYGTMPLAGKSGTTSDNVDYWFIGMNPYYVMGVWEGFDTQDYVKTVKPHPTQLMFKQVMSTISEGLEEANFPTCDTVTALRFCQESGMLAAEGCTKTSVGYYKKGEYPGYCNGIMHGYVKAEPTA